MLREPMGDVTPKPGKQPADVERQEAISTAARDTLSTFFEQLEMLLLENSHSEDPAVWFRALQGVHRDKQRFEDDFCRLLSRRLGNGHAPALTAPEFREATSEIREFFSSWAQGLGTDVKVHFLIYRLFEHHVISRLKTALDHTLPHPSSAADELIDRALAGDTVPAAVASLLGGPWRRVLRDTWDRHGEDSQEWRDRQAFVGALLWSVALPPGPQGRSALVPAIPLLLQTLQSGLRDAGVAPEQIAMLQKSLEPHHLRILALEGKGLADAPSGQAATDSDLPPPCPATADLMADQPPPELQELLEDAYTAAARGLAPGQVVDFKDDQGRVRRVKLAWKSELMGEYTFLDWKHKVVEKSLGELADDLRQGRAALVRT